MDSSDKDFTKIPVRVDKTLSWLKDSRDAWREKTKETKKKLKIATLGVKRARDDRDEIEKELHNKDELIEQKDIEIAKLKKQLEEASQEVEKLKKKR